MSKKIREQCTCPYCGSDNISWYDSDFDDPYMTYNGVCNSCERNFDEVYELKYCGYNTFDVDGEKHFFDEKGNEL